MRRVLGLLGVVGLGVGLVGVHAPAAVAKGPESATIEGGGRVVSVGWETTRGRGTMDDLLDVTSFWQVTDARTTAEPARKGPAFVVRYVLGRNTAGVATQEFRQVLYPASSAGSVVYTPGGQQRFGEVVPAHWGEAPVNLSLFLRSYGILVPVAAAPASTPVATPVAITPVAAENENRRPGWWPAAGLVVLVLLGATGAWLVRRRSA